jgi:ABC-2 type transport system ATP-binding protein
VKRPASSTILDVHDVSRTYGKRRALAHVNLAVAAGEVVALLGPNGAGKSTLFSIVAGLRRADSGAVSIGSAMHAPVDPAARRLLGYAPQDIGIYPTLTVAQNLVFASELHGLEAPLVTTRCHYYSHVLRLEHLLTRRASDLSGGEQRRLHVAMAMVHQPDLLLLDEPTVGADIETRQAILEVVRKECERGAGVLYSTHYLPEIEVLDGRVAILYAGSIRAFGSSSEVIAAHAKPLIRISFDGPVPPQVAAVATGEGVADVPASNAEVELPRVIAALGAEVSRVRSIEVKAADLETAYLSLTRDLADEEELDGVST